MKKKMVNTGDQNLNYGLMFIYIVLDVTGGLDVF